MSPSGPKAQLKIREERARSSGQCRRLRKMFAFMALLSLLSTCRSSNSWDTQGLGRRESPTPPRAVVLARMGQHMCWLYPAHLPKPTPTRLPRLKPITRTTLLTCPQESATVHPPLLHRLRLGLWDTFSIRMYSAVNLNMGRQRDLMGECQG